MGHSLSSFLSIFIFHCKFIISISVSVCRCKSKVLQNFLTFFQIITYDVNVTFMRMAVAKAVFSTKMARILLICQIEIKNI